MKRIRRKKVRHMIISDVTISIELEIVKQVQPRPRRPPPRLLTTLDTRAPSAALRLWRALSFL